MQAYSALALWGRILVPYVGDLKARSREGRRDEPDYCGRIYLFNIDI
jgi:hypothetical protein